MTEAFLSLNPILRVLIALIGGLMAGFVWILFGGIVVKIISRLEKRKFGSIPHCKDVWEANFWSIFWPSMIILDVILQTGDRIEKLARSPGFQPIIRAGYVLKEMTINFVVFFGSLHFVKWCEAKWRTYFLWCINGFSTPSSSLEK